MQFYTLLLSFMAALAIAGPIFVRDGKSVIFSILETVLTHNR